MSFNRYVLIRYRNHVIPNTALVKELELVKENDNFVEAFQFAVFV